MVSIRRRILESDSGILPNTYQHIEYVQRGTSVSNTAGYNSTYWMPSGDKQLDIYAGAMAIAQQADSAGGYVCGSRQNNSGDTVGYGIYFDQNTTRIGKFNGVSAYIEPEGGNSIRNIKYDLHAVWTPDSVSITDGTHSDSNTGTSRAIVSNTAVFGCVAYNSSQLRHGLKGRIYYLRIYEDGELKVNFIPCRRLEDDMVGFYDTVSQAFRSNGNYTAGPDV